MGWLRDRMSALEYGRRQRRLAGQMLLKAFAGAYPGASFVEVGANDGAQSDHLAPFIEAGRWRGIMVEPSPSAFRRLRQRYASNPQVMLENAAIATRDGRLPFWEVRPPSAGNPPELIGSYDLLGSLSREALVDHPFLRDVESRLMRTEVEALTLPSLLRKHGFERVDLVLVDTEGYDYEIVKQVELGPGRPRMLIYEHCLLAPADREACRTLLAGAGYELMEEFFDTWCLDTTIEDRVTTRWRRLRPSVPGVSLR